MAERPPHGCAVAGCPELVRRGARCPDHFRALQAEMESLRPSASRRGYGSAWRRARLDHLRRNPLCVDCTAEGRTTAATDVDHVVALRRGGANSPSNYASRCHHHHSSKTAREDGRFGPRPRRPA